MLHNISYIPHLQMWLDSNRSLPKCKLKQTEITWCHWAALVVNNSAKDYSVLTKKLKLA